MRKIMTAMKSTFITVLLFCSIFSSPVSHAKSSDVPPAATTEAKRITKTPIAGWGDLPALPVFNKERLGLTENGIAYLLQEDRVMLTDTGYNYFGRLAYEIIDRKGLESAAQISHSFDPELGSLSYNFINVTRAGKTVDRLPALDIQELRREDELSSGLVDGDITSLIQLEDIRVGDIIDVGFYKKYQAPLWPGHYFNNVRVKFGVPLAVQRYEISVPRDTILNIDSVNANPRPRVSHKDGRTNYLYEIFDSEITTPVSHVPQGIVTSSNLLISTMQSWDEVSEWGVGVYDIDMALPADYRAKVRQIKKANKTSEARMVAALKLVQNDIRYLGVETGINSHQPRTPSVTLSRGYGDCKDKTMLLIATLGELGIKASPALVSISTGHVISQLLPSIGNFDHVIVMANIDGRTYWLDPTLTYQGGNAETLTVADYGYALPLKDGQKDLVKIEIPSPLTPTTHITETYTLTSNGTLSLDVETVFRSTDADVARRKFARNSFDATSKSYLDYYANFYPGLVNSHKMRVTDDDSENTYTVFEFYELPAKDYIENKIGEKLYVKAVALEGQLPTKLESDRSIKLGLNKGMFLRHTAVVKTPGRQFVGPESVTLEAPGVTFNKTYTSKDETLTIDYTLKITESSVPLADAREVTKLAKDIASAIEINVYPKAAKEKLSKRLGLEKDIPEEIENALLLIGRHLKKDDNIQALEQLNILETDYLTADALRGHIQLLRGAVLEDMDRDQEAVTAFEEAFKLHDPDTSDTYYTYSALLRYDDRDVDSAKIIERLLIILPEKIKTLKHDWAMRLASSLYRAEEMKPREDLMIAMAQAQLRYIDDIPASEQLFENVIPMVVKRGELDKADLYLPYLMDPNQIAHILMDRDMKPIWETVSNLSGADLSIALEKNVEHWKKLADKDDADFKTYTYYQDALQKVGHFTEAEAFAKDILENWSRLEAVGEYAYWFVNSHAYTLAYMGKHGQADALMDKLLEGRLADQPDLVNQAINHVTLLTFNKDFSKALNLIQKYEDSGDFNASDYGWMFLHQSRACAMAETGDRKTASDLYAENTKDIQGKNPAAHLLALICLGDMDKAAEVMITRLESVKFRKSALKVFLTTQPAKNTSDYKRRLMAGVRNITLRADVQDVFKKYARPLYVNGPGEHWEEW